METLSMSNVSVEAQAAHVAAAVAAAVQLHHHHHPEHQQQHSPNGNNNTSNGVSMDQQELEENLGDLTEMQEIEEIQENIVSIPKEVILISLVSQEQALYNPKHEHYRNSQRKDSKWLDIAESVGWTDTQCKAKWKAMRDQYCRELKRSKFNTKANVKWKYFKELDFLRPYALSRNYRPRNSLNTTTSSSNSNNISTLHTNTGASATINNNNFQDNNNKFPNIKIETTQFNTSEFVAAQLKNENRLIATLTNEQLNVMQQQDGNWNYITTTGTLSRSNNDINGTNNNNNNNGVSNGNSMQTTTATTNVADDALYNSFVAQITQQNVLVTTGQMHQQQHQQHTTVVNQSQNADEEDDDPIHTFLNIESYFEKELITMIQMEDILYNSFHPNYRNVKIKLEVWDDIARKLKKTVKQCRLKWKALRDQYIREHKRLKNRENPESLPRWKHYDALSFLQKFIKHKSGEIDLKNIIEIPKTEIDTDMDEGGMTSPTVSPLHTSNELHQQHLQQQLQILPSLSGPHTVAHNNSNNNTNNSTHQVQNTLQQQLQQSLHHQQQQLLQHTHHQTGHEVNNDDHEETMCVASADVSGYDEMDITDYIIGDGDDGGPGDDDVDDDEDIDRKSQQFPDYSHHEDAATSNDNDVEDELKQQQNEFKTSQDSSITQAQTPNSHSLSQQSAVMQQHLQQHQQQPQQQHQHIVNDETIDETEQQQNFTDSLHVSLLNNNKVTVTNGTATTSATSSSGCETLNATVLTTAATINSVSNNAATTTTDDDEVGAFFKAIAMKIRNAKMSPVAFTDLQIDILRVINETLRNH